MIKITALFWVALLALAGGTVMHVSYKVRHVQEHISQIARETRHEQDALRVLTAEWNSLNDPQRIDALAKRYLPLKPTPIQRVVALDAIPLKPTADQLAKATPAKPSGKVPAKTPEAIQEAKASVPAPRPSAVARATLPRPVAPPVTPTIGLLRIKAEQPE